MNILRKVLIFPLLCSWSTDPPQENKKKKIQKIKINKDWDNYHLWGTFKPHLAWTLLNLPLLSSFVSFKLVEWVLTIATSNPVFLGLQTPTFDSFYLFIIRVLYPEYSVLHFFISTNANCIDFAIFLILSSNLVNL